MPSMWWTQPGPGTAEVRRVEGRGWGRRRAQGQGEAVSASSIIAHRRACTATCTAGEEGAFRQYESRLAAATSRYSRVVFLGDSMGATAALLLAPLATAVHAFCPQVDLASSSIRPGEGGPWFEGLKGRVLASVAAAARGRAALHVHVGNWRHDIEQVRLLPAGGGVATRVYSVDSHRLALALDRQGRLLPLVRGEVLRSLGREDPGQVRLGNLV